MAKDCVNSTMSKLKSSMAAFNTFDKIVQRLGPPESALLGGFPSLAPVIALRLAGRRLGLSYRFQKYFL